jgi:pimeloyl-ACP methyl ester carboxylesterase
VREFPLFIPHEKEHLGAVATVPDGEARAMVLLLTGTGAPRSHRFQMWTKAARGLAEHGIASLRLDYLGVGDSTGVSDEVPLDEDAVGQMLSAVRFGARAVGTDRIGVVGNCSGALTALYLASELPNCEGAICILPRVLQPSGVNKIVIGARGSKLASVVRSNRLLRPLANRFRGRRGRLRSSVGMAFRRALAHGRMLFVYSEQDTDAYSRETVEVIERMLASLPEASRARFELRVLTNGPLSGFEAVEIQRDVIETVVSWCTLCFGGDGAKALTPEQGAVSL